MTSDAIWPSEELRALRVGEISADRVATVGGEQQLFLFQGSNHHYRSYSRFMEAQSIDVGRRWANLTAQRHANSTPSMQMLSLYVPNPASCMPDLYPMPLQLCPTPAFQEMRRLLSVDDGVLFCDELFVASAPEERSIQAPWHRTDSHWTEFGCLLVVNTILRRLGLESIATRRMPIDPEFMAGDLGAHFGKGVGVMHTDAIAFDGPVPQCVFDSGGGALEGASMGRRVEWLCPDAPIDASIVIVGNSFAGSGLLRDHLTYWLSRVFRRVVFLHGASIPTDVANAYAPDILLFQGIERFLELVPVDAYTAEECERIYEPQSGER